MTLVYGLCLISGVCLERRLPLNSLVQRVVMIFTGAAAQLIFSLQVLSLPRWLTGPGVLAANLCLTLVIFATARLGRSSPYRLPWGTVLANARRTGGEIRRAPLALGIAALAVGAIVVHNALGAYLIVHADPYHFEMPFFWMQHASLLPFPVSNPRVCALSFAAEGMALPGCLYAHTPAAFPVLCGVGALMSLAIVFSLARRLGASPAAAACAAGILTGYTQYAVTFVTAQAAFFLAGMWAAASALFLIESRAHGQGRQPEPARFLCSIACFALACGAKNSALLMAPFYLASLFLLFRGRWLQPRLLATAILIGGLGLACSGVIWNYASNRLWYGHSGGPQLLQEALSRERQPRAVWTRLSRAGVLIALDTIWIPNSLQHTYVSLCRGVIKAVGAQPELAEDNDFYGLPDRALAPRAGLGLLGIAFFLPGLAVGIACWVRPDRPGAPARGLGPQAGAVLVLMAAGSFVLCHVVMRWQSIGLLRLCPGFMVVGAALAARLLERRWTRGAALGLLALSSALFFLFDLGLAARRWDGTHHGESRNPLARLQHDHEQAVEYQWADAPPQPLRLREAYSTYEIYDKLFEQAHQPEVFAFVGGQNAACFYLFGRHFENRVIPLVDARTPDRIAEPPPEVQYVVFGEADARAKDWAAARHFQAFFRVTKGDECVFAVYQRERLSR